MSKKNGQASKPEITFGEALDKLKVDKIGLQLAERQLLEKAFSSNDPTTLLKAQQYWADVQPRGRIDSKSLLVDPFSIYQSLGYKERPTGISYSTLRNMAAAPIIRAIIGTRIEQVAYFSTAQDNEQAVGWMIRKRKGLFQKDYKMTIADQKTAESLTYFMMNGGVSSSNWHADDFDTFLRKIVPDSMILDQMTFEIIRNRIGQPLEFFATDGATFRVLDQSKIKQDPNKIEINGYYPTYVQVVEQTPRNDFYPWELCFGIRNPSTNIYKNGYGRSELEDLIKIVTWMLYGDTYNGKFFSQGAAPKGILKLSGNVNENRVLEFKQQWQAQVAGVMNAWKTPVLEADKMEWIDLQKSNRDMEFSRWNEYLIKLTCAIYKMDPAEIGFPLGGSATQGQSLFEGSNQVRLEYSQEKGLKPLLRFLMRKINKYIINPINPEFEFVWVGIDLEDEQKILEADIKKVTNFEGLKEVRKRRNLPPELAKDDIILNGIWFQFWNQQKMMGGQGSNDALANLFGTEQNPYTGEQELGGEGEVDEVNPFTLSEKDEEGKDNPFTKALIQETEKLINED